MDTNHRSHIKYLLLFLLFHSEFYGRPSWECTVYIVFILTPYRGSACRVYGLWWGLRGFAECPIFLTAKWPVSAIDYVLGEPFIIHQSCVYMWPVSEPNGSYLFADFVCVQKWERRDLVTRKWSRWTIFDNKSLARFKLCVWYSGVHFWDFLMLFALGQKHLPLNGFFAIYRLKREIHLKVVREGVNLGPIGTGGGSTLGPLEGDHIL